MNTVNKYYWTGRGVSFFSGLVFVLLACLTQVCGEDLSGVSEEQAFDGLSLRIKKERLSGKDCEELGYVDETGGKITVVTLDGFESEMSFDNEYEGCRFELELRSREELRLEEIKLECRFFYTVEQEWRGLSRWQEEKVKYMDCSLSCTLEAGSRIKIKTDPFVMNSYEAPSGVSLGGAEVVECSPEGIWIRMIYTTSDGKEIQRDICDPESLSEDITWAGKSI